MSFITSIGNELLDRKSSALFMIIFIFSLLIAISVALYYETFEIAPRDRSVAAYFKVPESEVFFRGGTYHIHRIGKIKRSY